MARSVLLPVRRIIPGFMPHVAPGAPLLLDALDEALAAGADDPLGRVAAFLHTVDRPRFWLSCRSADWLGRGGAAALRDCAPAGLVVALLLPLTDEQIEALARSRGIVGTDLLSSMDKAGLLPLLRNPLTLSLVLDLGLDGLPASRLELYERSVALLAEESSHRPRRPGAFRPPKADLLEVAGAICASLLIAGESAVSIDAGSVSAIQLQPFYPPDLVLAVISTRIFVSAGEDRWEPPHRTIAEFLGARFIAHRVVHAGLPLIRVIALLCGQAPSPHPSLRGVFAWLVAMLPNRAAELIELDPYGVVSYGDPSCLLPAERRALLLGLEHLSEREPWFRSQALLTPMLSVLSVPDLSDDLQRIISARPVQSNLLSCACDALSAGDPRPELAASLETLLLDSSVDSDIRSLAVHAYVRVSSGDATIACSLFQRLVSDPSSDSTPRLAGSLFLLLFPAYLGLPDLVALLATYVSSHANGDLLHLELRLLSILPQGSEGDLLDALVGCPWATTAYADSLSRLAAIQEALGPIAARAILALPIGDGRRLLTWLPLLAIDAVQEGGRRALPDALMSRPDFLPALVPIIAKMLDPAHLVAGRHLVIVRMRAALGLLRWPASANVILLAAAREERDPEMAARLFASALDATGDHAGLESAWLEEAHHLAANNALLQPIMAAFCKPVPIYPNPVSAQLLAQQQALYSQQAARTTQNIQHLEARISGIRDGTDTNALEWIALRWFDRVASQDNAANISPRSRLLNILPAHLVGAAEDGFMAYAKAGAIPSPSDLADRVRARSHPCLQYVILAGTDLLFAAHAPELPDLPPARLMALLCLSLFMDALERGSDRYQGLRPWMARVASALPQETSSALITFISPQLAVADAWIFGLDMVCVDAAFEPIRREVVRALLPLAQHATGFGLLAGTALQVLPLAEVLAAAEAGMTRTRSLSPDQFWPWLHLAWRLDYPAHEQEIRALMAATPSLHIRLAEGTGDTLAGSNRLGLPLTIEHRCLVLQVLSQLYPVVGMSGGVSGITHQYQLGHVVQANLDYISRSSDLMAGRVLGEMSDDPQFAFHKEHIRQSLAVWRREQNLRFWSWPTVAGVAAALRSGPPATAADLSAFVEAHLREVGASLGVSAANVWQEFWNLDRGSPTTPRVENDSRDGLCRILEPRLKLAHVTQATEVRQSGDDRCDIVMTAALGCSVPIEVKCDWHKSLWTAWRTQLAKRYSINPAASGQGVYLVFWFGPARGSSRRVKPGPDGLQPTGASDLETKLTTLVRESGLPIRVVVLDVSPVKPLRSPN